MRELSSNPGLKANYWATHVLRSSLFLTSVYIYILSHDFAPASGWWFLGSSKKTTTTKWILQA